MTVFEPFPGNYVWNLSVNLAICMGGSIGEMDIANAQVRAIAAEGDDLGTEAFFDSWGAMADRLAELGKQLFGLEAHLLRECERD